MHPVHDDSGSRIRIYLSLIAGLAFLIRLGAILHLGDFRPPWTEDWEIIAQTLVAKGYFGLDPISLYGPNPREITSFIPPLYPAFLALMMLVSGPWAWFATRLVQAIISTLGVVLVYFLGRAAFNRSDVPLLGALLAAVFPPLVGGVVEINAVSFEVFFFEVFVLLLWVAMYRYHAIWWYWAATGMALGIAALTRPTVLAFLPLLFVSVWVNRRASFLDAIARPMLCLIVSAAAVISPWTLRNYRVHGELILISSNGGVNFWIGNNAQATGEFIEPPYFAPDLLEASEHLSEGARDRFFYQQGLLFILKNPQQFMRLLGNKLAYFLVSRPSAGETYLNQSAIELGRLAYLAGNGFLLPFWILGLALTWRGWRRLSVMYSAILSVLLVNLLYFVGTRYRTPASPFQILFASYALVMGARYLHQQFRAKLLLHRQQASASE